LRDRGAASASHGVGGKTAAGLYGGAAASEYVARMGYYDGLRPARNRLRRAA